jgi:hypothetical protein
MGDPLTVYVFLRRHRNQGFCDECIQRSTGVHQHQVDTITSTLALFPAEFTRVEGVCSEQCSQREQTVTAAI